MLKVGLFVRLEAKPGKEPEVAAFLESALPMVIRETQTSAWFAAKLGPSTFAIFDAFADEAGRQAHLNGQIAKTLLSRAGELLARAPVIEKLDIIAAKIKS
jgi:quinol monooxygenase YgiN